MEIPKSCYDAIQNPSAETTHGPRMKNSNDKVWNISIKETNDRAVNDLLDDFKIEVTKLQGIVVHQNAFIKELLQLKIGRPELFAPPYMCNLCYEVDMLTGDKSCPCGLVHYCSTGCQQLDWERSHKYFCPFATGAYDYSEPPTLVTSPGYQEIAEIL